MVVNPHVEMLFIDYGPQYMRTVKHMLEQGSRLPGEQIHLSRSVSEARKILRERDTIEMIALHIGQDKSTVKQALRSCRN